MPRRAHAYRLAGLMAGLALAGGWPRVAAGVVAVPANDFLTSICINTHIDQGYSWQSYTNALNYTGIRCIRSGAGNGSATPYVNLYRQTGVRVAIFGTGNVTNHLGCATGCATNGALLAIEGPNEPNNFPFKYYGVQAGGGALPDGLAVNTGTGLLSGTPTKAGTYAIALRASKSSNVGWGVLTLSVSTNAAFPRFTSAAAKAATVGSAFSYQMTATNSPTGFDAAFLPPGLAVNPGTGLISGTNTAAGTWAVTLTARNASGTGRGVLLIVVSASASTAPVITSAASAVATVGSAFSYTITATQSPTGYNALPSWVPVAQYQRDLYAAAKSSAVLSNYPVFHVSEGGAEPDNVGMQWLTIPTNSGCIMPPGTRYADFANPHNYVCGTSGSLASNQAWNASDPVLNSRWDGMFVEYHHTWYGSGYDGYSLAALPGVPRVTTETGWSTGGSRPITAVQQGKLYLNLYLSAWKRGWRHTFIYQMRDGEGGDSVDYGIYHANWTGKAAATNLHNLTTILADTVSHPPGSLNYSIPGQAPTVHDLLLQKSDGTLYLAVWDERVPGASTNSVTVNLGTNCVAVRVYDPTVGVAPLQTLSNISAVAVGLSDHPLLLAIVPGDSIGDGIPDWWRRAHFGGTGTTTNALSCATCDAVGTGQNNRFKYVAGLNPTNPASVFRFDGASVSNQAAQFALQFGPVATGRTYTAQWSTDLVKRAWLPLTAQAGPVTNGLLGTITDLDAVPPGKYYRLRIGMP